MFVLFVLLIESNPNPFHLTMFVALTPPMFENVPPMKISDPFLFKAKTPSFPLFVLVPNVAVVDNFGNGFHAPWATPTVWVGKKEYSKNK